MKAFIVLFILVELINLSFTLVPLWNLEKSSIDLLDSDNSKEYIVYSNTVSNFHVELKKEIKKDDSGISDQNYISVFQNGFEPTDWEDIESIYHLDIGSFVCPKGKNFINQYSDNKFTEIIPENFNKDNNDWELLCYNQPDKKWIFQGFLNSKEKTFFYGKQFSTYYNNKYEWKYLEIEDGIFDFLWTVNPMSDDRNHNMFTLILQGSEIYLRNIIITIDNKSSNNIFQNPQDKLPLEHKSEYTHAYFSHSSNTFYWISSNSVSDFKSGYSTEKVDISSSNVNIGIKKNEESPFKFFLKDIQIINLNMIRNTRFAYYEVKSNQNEIFRGIIDIELNQIIFNTNETLTAFKPFKNYTMLAFTQTKAYQICPIKENGKCVERCSSKEIILDTEKGNYCGDKTSQKCDHYKLIPDNICIKDCNESVYTKSDSNECGLCKDLNTNAKYKIINKEGCLKDRPENTYYINKYLEILNYCDDNCKNCSSFEVCNECYDNYKLENGKCIKKECYQNCADCYELSNDENNQKCTKCKDGFYFYEEKGNCLTDCPNKYYKNNFNCSKCHEKCETCSKGPENENNTENQNCQSCSPNLYLIDAEGFPKNCVSECPNGTNKTDNKYCKIINDNNDENQESNLMIWIFIILTSICLIFIILCICKAIRRDKKSDVELINDISTELEESNNKINN